jgi:DNA-binding CsgD family transcriptional regulator
MAATVAPRAARPNQVPHLVFVRTITRMLVGREAEQQQISALVAGARVRQSGVLLLRGEAGIGKTALLDDTALHAGEMQVLRTSGSEYESGLGFSGLHQLLRSALHLIDRIPEPQREALAVALLLRDGPAPERFAVGAAALSLLSRYAEETPLLLLVDDAHLLDSPTAETLHFVARRLVADPIALLISTRPEPDVVLNDAGLPVLELAGLDLSAATALLARTSGGSPSDALTTKLHQATGGNPLALVELAPDIDRFGQLFPEMPLPVPETVARAFARRVSALSQAAQRALLLAVVADGDLSLTSRAAGALSGSVDSLAEAERVGLLHLQAARAEFRHPLVRSAVYASAEPDERRAAHRAVAAALPETSIDRRTWQLSAACVGPDDGVADALAELADRERGRGAYGAAAEALARSAELASAYSARGLRLMQAGEAAWLAGRVDQADEHLRRAAELLTDPRTLAEIDGTRGNLALRTGSLRVAQGLLTQGAARTEAVDADVSAQLLADAVTASFYLCDTSAGLAAAALIERLLDDCRSDAARIRGQMAIGIARVLAGGEGVHWIRGAVAALAKEPERFDDPRRPDWSVIGTLFLRESGAGRDLVGRVVGEQRARTAIGALPNLLFHVARDDATTDRWTSALTGFTESITLARETGQTTDLAVSLAGLAWLQARMGRAEECGDNCQEVLSLAQQHQIALAELWARFALGDMSLSAGDATAAVRHFEELRTTMRRVGFGDVDLVPGPELAEAQLRCGDTESAASTAHDYLCLAQDKGQPWALARANRAAALCNPDPSERIALFEQALECHTSSLDLYEEARTRLAFGGSLRRDRSRVAARPHLRTALEQFDRLGARPWADLAARELDATGERARRRGETHLASLTAQEIQIARMLGAGKTTKEAAAALFLSPKTVEYHLRHLYQKLGIGSRAELAVAMNNAPV